MGAILAVGFYRFVKALEYETANPGQDFNEKEAENFEFDEDNAATGADVSRPDPVSRTGTGQMLNSADRTGTGEMLGPGDRTHSHAVLSTVSSKGSEQPGVDDRPFTRASQAESGELGGSYRVHGL